MDPPTDELRETRQRKAHFRVVWVFVSEKLSHPHSLFQPPAVHIDSEEAEVGVPDPGVAPSVTDPAQQVAGEALVFFGLHLGSPGEVQVENGGREQVEVESAVPAGKSVEELLGLIPQPIHRNRHAGADRGREVAAPVHREPGCVGVEVPLLRIRSARQHAQGGRRERRPGQPPRANSSHPVSAASHARAEPLSHRPVQKAAGTMTCFPVSARCVCILTLAPETRRSHVLETSPLSAWRRGAGRPDGRSLVRLRRR